MQLFHSALATDIIARSGNLLSGWRISGWWKERSPDGTGFHISFTGFHLSLHLSEFAPSLQLPSHWSAANSDQWGKRKRIQTEPLPSGYPVDIRHPDNRSVFYCSCTLDHIKKILVHIQNIEEDLEELNDKVDHSIFFQRGKNLNCLKIGKIRFSRSRYLLTCPALILELPPVLCGAHGGQSHFTHVSLVLINLSPNKGIYSHVAQYSRFFSLHFLIHKCFSKIFYVFIFVFMHLCLKCHYAWNWINSLHLIKVEDLSISQTNHRTKTDEDNSVTQTKLNSMSVKVLKAGMQQDLKDPWMQRSFPWKPL